jgi:hypothetical protein
MWVTVPRRCEADEQQIINIADIAERRLLMTWCVRGIGELDVLQPYLRCAMVRFPIA